VIAPRQGDRTSNAVKPARTAADQSKAKGHRHEAQSRIIPDSTETDPVYVWGDEGPIND
jgi:hypothetical protein